MSSKISISNIAAALDKVYIPIKLTVFPANFEWHDKNPKKMFEI